MYTRCINAHVYTHILACVYMAVHHYFNTGVKCTWKWDARSCILGNMGCSPWGRWESDLTERLHFSLFTFMHWRRKWQPTPVFLPGEPQGRGSLVGCRLWGRTESDTTEATYQQQQQQQQPVVMSLFLTWLCYISFKNPTRKEMKTFYHILIFMMKPVNNLNV